MSLRTKNLTVGYGKRVVIKDACLSVESGKILTLIGPNGSGKSTILKTMTRQLKELSGEVFLLEKDMKSMKDEEVAKNLSMVMTERLRPELMTCREVVATGRYPYTGRLGILSQEDWEKVDEAMTLLHADETKDMYFTQISDGQKQRVMLARALCQDTGILVLDEPTSYLDMRFKLEILGNIRKLVQSRKLAVVMSLHELDLAQKVSDVIACVEGDSIGRVGTPEEIFDGSYVQQLYGVSKESFSPLTGSMFFEGNKKEPEVFVIGGAGSAIHLYQRLQREDIPFAAGILQENDLEYEIAKACGSKVIYSKAFEMVDEKLFEEAKKILDGCEKCVCTLQKFGTLNAYNEKLLAYAKATGKYLEMETLWQK